MNLKSVKSDTWVKLLVTLGALALLGLRMRWPERVDATTMGFLVVAILPWLSSVFASIEFPGGGGVTFREKVAAARVSADTVVAESAAARGRIDLSGVASGAASVHGDLQLTTPDPNLAFVALRIDVERAVSAIAARHGVSGRTTRELVRNLMQHGSLTSDVADAVNNLIYVGNQAAHGMTIDASTGVWARENGPKFVAVLQGLAAADPPRRPRAGT